jgi:hypothetical protein
MERGKWSLDAVFDSVHDWCLATLPVEPGCLGEAQREVHAIDSSTIARLRAGQRLAVAGKGSCHRAGRAVRANIVAALTRVVMIGGVRVGLVRRTRFGSSCQEAVERLFAALPPATGQRLMVVAAGIATKEQFAAATAQDALWDACASIPNSGVLRHRPVATRGALPCMARACSPGVTIPRLSLTWSGRWLGKRERSGCGAGARCTMKSFLSLSWMWCGLMIRPTISP